MIYVALLRGINVGGKNKVDMHALRGVRGRRHDVGQDLHQLRQRRLLQPRPQSNEAGGAAGVAIAAHFRFHVKVLVRDVDGIRAAVEAVDAEWADGKTMKCDVMFLWDDVDRPDVLDDVTIKPGIDEVRHVPGAIVWKVDRDSTTRSGMMKLAGTSLYKQMTIRNCNTARKLLELMDEARRK